MNEATAEKLEYGQTWLHSVDSGVVEELVSIAKSADSPEEARQEAFGQVAEATYPSVYMLAHSLVHKDEDAADVTQEVYKRAWKGLPKFRGDALFSSWLYRITINAAKNHYRRSKDVPVDLASPEYDETSNADELAARRALSDYNHVPEDYAEQDELKSKVWQALGQLSLKLRNAVILHDIMDLPNKQVGEVLGIKENNVKIRVHRGRARLKDILYPTYGNK